jgi:signal transduction histidine kinase
MDRHRGTICGVGIEVSLWRAIAVYRVGALAYAIILAANSFRGYERPVLGWIVIAVMTVWTGVAAWAYNEPGRRRWPLLMLDFAIGAGALYATGFVIDRDLLRQGVATLPMAWVAGPVLAWAIWRGMRLAALAALGLAAIDGLNRGFTSEVTLNGAVLLLLAGVIMGYIYSLAARAELRMQQAAEREAASKERERLARGIHDSVLQALALIQRRGAEIGGDAVELGSLAGEQSAILRTLVSVGMADQPSSVGEVDLRAVLSQYASPAVSVAVPATPVHVAAPVAAEVVAAVGAALGNVTAHAGTDGRAWVLIEDEDTGVTVTVRDEGVGMASTRLAEAEAAGRLGVAQSIRGRIHDVAGTVSITTAPGMGTEVEMRVPRQPMPAA